MIRRHRGLIGGGIISSLLLINLFCVGVAAAQISRGEADKKATKPAAKADFVITVKNNLISLKAKDASLKEVLEEIGRKTKIDVVAGIPDTKKITAKFENLPIEEAVNRLTTNYSYVMDSTNGETKIIKIIVLEKGKETTLSTPRTKKEEQSIKPETKAREDIGKGINESAIKKEEKSAKPEGRAREEALRKESPPPKRYDDPYVLMLNHLHPLLEAGDVPLSNPAQLR
jgi:hypothetical protein